MEVAQKLKEKKGFEKSVTKRRSGIVEIKVKIKDEETSKKLEREKGCYVSFSFSDLLYFDIVAKENLTSLLKQSIKSFVKDMKISAKKILVVGLGNEKFACDSLGKRVTERVLITKPYLERELLTCKKVKEIYAVSLGVYGTTGIETSKTIKSLCKVLNPDLVIAIDSLVASQDENLAKSIQISDTKLQPGGGVGNNREEVSENSIGVKVLAVGVPLVVNLKGKNSDFIVTPKDVEMKVSVLSKIIAKAINLSFCSLTEKEYLELTA